MKKDIDFINAIVADPENSGLRLAYAAWLEERASTLDSERADLLRLQCELRGMDQHGENYWTAYGRLSTLADKLEGDGWPVWVNDDLAIPSGLSEKGRLAAMTILKVLAKDKFSLTGGCRLFWTPQEWQERGNQCGAECVLLVLVHDGPMHLFFTPSGPPEQWSRFNRMDKALRNQGMFTEADTDAVSYVIDEEKY